MTYLLILTMRNYLVTKNENTNLLESNACQVQFRTKIIKLYTFINVTDKKKKETKI